MTIVRRAVATHAVALAGLLWFTVVAPTWPQRLSGLILAAIGAAATSLHASGAHRQELLCNCYQPSGIDIYYPPRHGANQLHTYVCLSIIELVGLVLLMTVTEWPTGWLLVASLVCFGTILHVTRGRPRWLAREELFTGAIVGLLAAQLLSGLYLIWLTLAAVDLGRPIPELRTGAAILLAIMALCSTGLAIAGIWSLTVHRVSLYRTYLGGIVAWAAVSCILTIILAVAMTEARALLRGAACRNVLDSLDVHELSCKYQNMTLGLPHCSQKELVAAVWEGAGMACLSEPCCQTLSDMISDHYRPTVLSAAVMALVALSAAWLSTHLRRQRIIHRSVAPPDTDRAHLPPLQWLATGCGILLLILGIILLVRSTWSTVPVGAGGLALEVPAELLKSRRGCLVVSGNRTMITANASAIINGSLVNAGQAWPGPGLNVTVCPRCRPETLLVNWHGSGGPLIGHVGGLVELTTLTVEDALTGQPVVGAAIHGRSACGDPTRGTTNCTGDVMLTWRSSGGTLGQVNISHPHYYSLTVDIVEGPGQVAFLIPRGNFTTSIDVCQGVHCPVGSSCVVVGVALYQCICRPGTYVQPDGSCRILGCADLLAPCPGQECIDDPMGFRCVVASSTGGELIHHSSTGGGSIYQSSTGAHHSSTGARHSSTGHTSAHHSSTGLHHSSTGLHHSSTGLHHSSTGWTSAHHSSTGSGLIHHSSTGHTSAHHSSTGHTSAHHSSTGAHHSSTGLHHSSTGQTSAHHSSTASAGRDCSVHNGGCDPLTVCHLDGCGACPAGYIGTGATSCVSVCLTQNGGCDPHTTCSIGAGGRVCGSCPAGYTGTGLAGCVSVCLTQNGGCDPRTVCSIGPSGRICGPCPPGCTGTGATSCVSTCLTQNGGCDPLTTCTLGVSGRVCGTCPVGYTGSGAIGCVSVCLTQNGGCDPLTTCLNAPGGRICGACPSGYTGSGLTGCADIDECAINHGGCDVRASCVNAPGSYSCGPCPTGCSGTGQSGCVPITSVPQDVDGYIRDAWTTLPVPSLWLRLRGGSATRTGKPLLRFLSGLTGHFDLGHLGVGCYTIQIYRIGLLDGLLNDDDEDEHNSIHRTFCITQVGLPLTLIMPLLYDVQLLHHWSALFALSWADQRQDLDLQLWGGGCSVGYYQRACGGGLLNRDSRDSVPLVTLETIATAGYVPNVWYHLFVTSSTPIYSMAGATATLDYRVGSGYDERRLSLVGGSGNYWSLLCLRLAGNNVKIAVVNKLTSVAPTAETYCPTMLSA